MKNRPHWNGGFSLIELIISIVLLGLLAAVGTNMLSDSFDSTYILNASQNTAAQGRYTLERMEREIREMDPAVASTRDPSNFVFTKMPPSGATTGVLVTMNNTGNELTMKYDTGTAYKLSSQVVANAGGLPLFAYLKSDGSTADSSSNLSFVQITLTLRDTSISGQQNLEQRTRVAVRSK